jgi:hypothetical protein
LTTDNCTFAAVIGDGFLSGLKVASVILLIQDPRSPSTGWQMTTAILNPLRQS